MWQSIMTPVVVADEQAKNGYKGVSERSVRMRERNRIYRLGTVSTLNP